MAHVRPARRAENEDVVLGSRFITTVAPVETVADAMDLIDEQRRLHPDASHHCWAYRVGQEMRFSDDGEPGGSAGRPMLEVILKRELDACAAVVVRYFGGRKLGVGGLARAYGGGVARTLDLAGTLEVRDTTRVRVRAPFAAVDAVLRELGAAEVEFDDQGLVAVVVIETSALEELELRLATLTRGAVTLEIVH